MGVELRGIPETALWTLYMRASEAKRPASGSAQNARLAFRSEQISSGTSV